MSVMPPRNTNNYDPQKSQPEINQEIHEALYGVDGKPGLVQKMDDVSEILSAFKLFGRAVMWVALFLGGIGTAWAAFGAGVKHFFTGK
jgi:hypothetical protein